MKKPILNIENCLYYIKIKNEKFTILKNISLQIPYESITLITGRSGSGKTTLIHCLAGLITPQSGNIFFNSTNLCSLSSNKRANYRLTNTGIVYQSFNFLPSLTLQENITLPAIMANQTKNQYINHCNELCLDLNIQNLQHSLPQTVSGGELQRAALVRALINHPKLILADEPTGNLDTKNRDIIFNTFSKIKQEKKISIVFTSHDPKAKEIADYVIELDDGHVVT